MKYTNHFLVKALKKFTQIFGLKIYHLATLGYDFLNIFAENSSERIGVFDSKQS
jgi:hypothetical protein